eukprot:gene10071-12346_t
MESNNNNIEMEFSDISISHNNIKTETSVDINSYSLHNHMKEHSPSNKTGMFVSANNLSYYVEQKNKEKLYLLNNISFYLKPGRMTLLMGSPGSGKSVLIKTLANRWGKGKIEGSLLFNNHEIDSKSHQKDTVYVSQEDRHIALLTVRETLDFSAQSNMGEVTDEQVKKERVNLILDQLGLTHTSNTIVGNEFFRGISGGQKQDQPIAEFFQDVTEDPSRYLIESSETTPVINLAQLFKQSQYYSDVLNTIDSLIPNNQNLNDYSNQKIKKSSVLYETKNLLSRQIKIMKTNRLEVIIRFIQSTLMGIIIGTLYYNLGDNQAGAQNKLSVIYVAIFTQVWTVFGAVEEFYSLRGVFYDQKEGKFYRTFPYFVSIVITKFPVALVESFLFAIPCYWLAGLRGRADSFFLFVLGLTMTNWTSQGIFQAVSSLTPSLLTSTLLTPAVVILFLVFAGFMIENPAIPGWWIWLHYISPLKYTLDMLSQNELHGVTYGCSPSELIPPINLPNFNLSYADGGYNGVQICPRTSGDDFLEMFGMRTNYWFRWVDVVILFAFIFLFYSIVFAGLKLFNFETKKPTKTLKAKKSKKIKAKVNKNKHDIMGKCYMTIKNLTYTVDTKRKNVTTNKMENVTLTLLKNVNAYVKPGLMALMGASGAGKSTLLDVLAKRKNMGTITGEISINGIPTKDLNINRFTGYVEQQDILPESLTIREAIEFSANCRLPGSVGFEEKTRLIDEILSLLRYQHDPKRNPADFILEISEHYDPKLSPVAPVDAYKSSQQAANTESQLAANSIVPDGLTLPEFKGEYSAPFMTQFYCLMKRGWTNNVRRPSIIWMRIFRAIIPALIMGTLFLRLGQGQSDARNKLSMIYLGFFFAAMSAFGKIPQVVEDRAVFYRESSSSTYPPVLYLISIFITDLPMSIVTGFVYWIPLYFLTGLDLGTGGWKFFLSLLVYTLAVMCFDSLAISAAFFFPNVPLASIALGILLTLLTIFGGFYIPFKSIPKGWQWFNYMMFTKYGFETLGITEMDGQKFNCNDGGSFPIPTGDGNFRDYCPINSGEDMMNQYEFDKSRNYYNLLILPAFILGHNVFSYLSLKYIKHMNK